MAKELLEEMYTNEIAIRLVGMRVDGLIEKNEKQLSLTHETLYFLSFTVISDFFHPRCHCSAHIGPPLSFVIPLRL